MISLQSVVRRGAVAAVAALLLASVPAVDIAAQGTPPSRQQRPGQPRGDREMEQQVQRRIGIMLKERLSLTDDQLRQLEAVTMRLERDRRAVRSDEYRSRVALRAQLLAGDSASNDSVAVLLDRLPGIERRKIDLMEAEQRELGQFLTPIQRARFMALQEEIRRGMDDIRNRRPGAPGPSRPPSDRTPPPVTDRK